MKKIYTELLLIGEVKNCRLIKSIKNHTLAYALRYMKKNNITNWSIHHGWVHNTSEPDGLIAFSTDNIYWQNWY